MQTILPSDSLPLNETVQVSVDEQTINSLVRQSALTTTDAGAALGWLRDEFIVEGPRPWMAILRAPGGPGDWKLIGRRGVSISRPSPATGCSSAVLNALDLKARGMVHADRSP